MDIRKFLSQFLINLRATGFCFYLCASCLWKVTQTSYIFYLKGRRQLATFLKNGKWAIDANAVPVLLTGLRG